MIRHNGIRIFIYKSDYGIVIRQVFFNQQRSCKIAGRIDQRHMQTLLAFLGNESHAKNQRQVQQGKQQSGNDECFFAHPGQVFAAYDDKYLITLVGLKGD